MSTHKPEFLYLTTTGRASGKPRELEIWYVEHADRYYLCAQNRERAQWVRNIQREPRVSIRLGERMLQGRARILGSGAEPELHAAVARLFDEKYGWSDGLLVELAPD